MRDKHMTCAVLLLAGCVLAGPALAGSQSDEDVLMRALVAELERSMTLQLEDLQPPFFVQYAVDDRASYRIAATCGAIAASDDVRSRRLSTSVRVGDYELDNTNFAGAPGGSGRRGRGGSRGAGGSESLPIEDSESAIRLATWLATDSAYKSAVETLAQKNAYMIERNIQDRPADFARAEPVVSIEPRAALALDVPAWERRLRGLSAEFLNHQHVLDSSVALAANVNNRYLVNSEGSRVRTGSATFVLTVSAQAQADDGEQLSDRFSVYAETAEGLPTQDELLARVNALADTLARRRQAPVLESYIGPVLFDGLAAPQMFHAMLARGVAGNPEPIGGGRRRFAGLRSLDKYLGKRILPRNVQVYDDPRAPACGQQVLAGHYTIDDEGVPAQRVDIVSKGRLESMVMSRTPTNEFPASNGHGRAAGSAGARAAIACLFVESSDPVAFDELKQELIDAVTDEGLEFGLLVRSISSGGGRMAGGRAGRRGSGRTSFGAGAEDASPLGDPVNLYKVYLDGREELVRGCEFGSIDVSTLKDIIAVGDTPIVYNTSSGMDGQTSVVAPPVLFEELELFTIEEDRPKLPALAAPHQRSASPG